VRTSIILQFNWAVSVSAVLCHEETQSPVSPLRIALLNAAPPILALPSIAVVCLHRIAPSHAATRRGHMM
jgi:hypothetical protein